MPGKNALETAVALGEFGNPFKGERFMRAETLRWLFEQLNENGIRYALIGDLAVSHYAIPRTTQDVDILVLQEDAGKLLQLLRPYYSRGTAQVMFFLIGETRVDITIATMRYQREAILNAQEVSFEGVPVKIVSPRDLVLTKLLSALAQQRFAKAELRAFAIPDARLKWQARIGSVFQRSYLKPSEQVAMMPNRCKEVTYHGGANCSRWRRRRWFSDGKSLGFVSARRCENNSR